MDELLWDWVKQLREIDDRLETIERDAASGKPVGTRLTGLRIDLARMIAYAEQAHADF